MIVNSHLAHPMNGRLQLPDTIIVHSMGEFILDQHAVGFLGSIKLSAHSLIGPDGTNYICREDTETASHAKGFNKNSLGIEFLVPGKHNYASFLEAIKHDYVTGQAYEAGLNQIKQWLRDWPIKTISRHSDVSPERKVDPGTGFPWQRLMNDIGM